MNSNLKKLLEFLQNLDFKNYFRYETYFFIDDWNVKRSFALKLDFNFMILFMYNNYSENNNTTLSYSRICIDHLLMNKSYTNKSYFLYQDIFFDYNLDIKLKENIIEFHIELLDLAII